MIRPLIFLSHPRHYNFPKAGFLKIFVFKKLKYSRSYSSWKCINRLVPPERIKFFCMMFLSERNNYAECTQMLYSKRIIFFQSLSRQILIVAQYCTFRLMCVIYLPKNAAMIRIMAVMLILCRI